MEGSVRDIEAILAETNAHHASLIATITAAFAASPAILLTYRGSRSDLAIYSGDPSEPGRVRVTLLAPDGPRGHVTRDDLAALVEAVIDYGPETARPATDAEVIAWTSTEEYVAGAERVEMIRRWNEAHSQGGRP
jgi:hypothetical protein